MNRSFENELSNVVSKFPNLSIREAEGQKILKGILDICDDSSAVIGSFSVEICPTEKFPYRFPKLFEVGGDIPCEADWHKYPDNSCCITVEQDEILKCKNGITLLYFVENMAVPYFANQLYRKRIGHYLNEFPHGKAGVKLFYTELFRTPDIIFWHLCLKYAFGNKQMRRNDVCYCNSGIKYKGCHMLIEEKLQIIGEQKVNNDINWITT